MIIDPNPVNEGSGSSGHEPHEAHGDQPTSHVYHTSQPPTAKCATTAVRGPSNCSTRSCRIEVEMEIQERLENGLLFQTISADAGSTGWARSGQTPKPQCGLEGRRSNRERVEMGKRRTLRCRCAHHIRANREISILRRWLAYAARGRRTSAAMRHTDMTGPANRHVPGALPAARR